MKLRNLKDSLGHPPNPLNLLNPSNPPSPSNPPNPLNSSNPPNLPNPPSPASALHLPNPCPHLPNPRFKDSPSIYDRSHKTLFQCKFHYQSDSSTKCFHRYDSCSSEP